MKARAPLFALTLFGFACTTACADDFDAQSFLGMSAGNNVGAAIKRGEKDGKKVLVFAYDSKKQGQSFHIEGMLDLEETRRLVRENFLIVLTDFKDRNIRDHVGNETQTRPMYFLFSTDSTLIQKGSAAVGAGQGNKLVAEWTKK